jgi:eukaryotic-like serine/threonine-protein kinase
MKVCPKCQKQYSDDANFCPVDAARLVPLEGQVAGGDTLTARFELGERLGGSHTGAVHRARDKQTGAQVAVKVVAPAVMKLPGVAQRLERELKQLERVQSAGVAKVHASGKRGEESWLAMELIDGAQTLAQAITARGPLPLDIAAHLVEVIGEALIEAAQVGVVHRDLAPKNVLFAGGDIKLINFSLPVPTNDRVPGVPEFVAPEQVEGRPVDQRSNLYSLGALYYYVLTGQTVHAGTADEVHKAHSGGQIRPPSALATVPQPIEGVIMRALDRSPTKRFLTVRQFVDEVGRVARGDADPRATAALGRAGRPKAELVQTLLGVRGVPVAPGHAPGSAPVQIHSAPVPAPMTAPMPSATVMPAPPQSPPHLAAPPMQAPVAVASAPPAAAAAAAAERSPWAPPSAGGGAMAGAAQAMAAAAPEIAKAAPIVQPPPQPAAPVMPASPSLPQAPVVAAAPAGKKKAAEPDTKGKFRETMWFKKGELDAEAAQVAAEERARGGKDVADKADALPMDERYKDDGTISRSDKEKYSLRTGATAMMKAMPKDGGGTSMRVSEDALMREMKKGRMLVVFLILLGLAGLSAIIYLIAR